MPQLKANRFYRSKDYTYLVRTLAEVDTTLHGRQMVAEVVRPPSSVISLGYISVLAGDDFEEMSSDLWECHFRPVVRPNEDAPMRFFVISVISRCPNSTKYSTVKFGLRHRVYPSNDYISQILDNTEWSSLVVGECGSENDLYALIHPSDTSANGIKPDLVNMSRPSDADTDATAHDDLEGDEGFHSLDYKHRTLTPSVAGSDVENSANDGIPEATVTRSDRSIDPDPPINGWDNIATVLMNSWVGQIDLSDNDYEALKRLKQEMTPTPNEQ